VAARSSSLDLRAKYGVEVSAGKRRFADVSTVVVEIQPVLVGIVLGILQLPTELVTPDFCSELLIRIRI
jgi:hypothetical protein